jgi:hypothetical protein
MRREDQPNRPNERTSEPKRGEAEQGPKSERHGQAPATEQTPREDRRSGATEGNHATEQERRRTDREENHGTVGQRAAGARANTNITSEKRTRIHETIIHERNVPRVSNVNFAVSVGTRVPRGVRFAALPETVVEIEPTWRGFEFFLVGDEIVIVDPGTLEIVAIVDA